MRWRASSSCGSSGWHRGVFPLLDVVVDRRSADDGRSCRSALRRHRPRASAKASRWRRASCWPRCCGTTCSEGWEQRQAARRVVVPGAAGRDRRGLRRPHRRHLRPRQAGRRHARDLDDAAAPRASAPAARRSTPGRAAALSCRLRLPAPARRRRRGRPGAGRLVGGLLQAADDERRACSRRCASRARPRRVRVPRKPPRTRRAGCRGRDGPRRERRPTATTGLRRRRRRARSRRRRGRGGAQAPPRAGAGRTRRPAAARAERLPVGRAGRRGLRRPRLQPGRQPGAARRGLGALRRLPGTPRRPIVAVRVGTGRRRRRRLRERRRRLRTTLAPPALLARCTRSRRGRARAPVSATRRARSTSTCCSTATGSIDGADAGRCRIRVCTSAPSSSCRCSRSRPTCAGGTAARRGAAGVAGQRLAELDR